MNDMNHPLIDILKRRFEIFKDRHPDIKWETVFNLLEKNPKAFDALYEMEKTGGEPDLVMYDQVQKHYIFMDCSKETPKDRVSLCYDEEARLERKKFPPEDSAIHRAEMMGIELLNEDEYRFLQKLGPFDTKTSSWIKTPDELRKLGGALFGDHRYGRTFIYHNGADSYYSVRGFRAKVVITG